MQIKDTRRQAAARRASPVAGTSRRLNGSADNGAGGGGGGAPSLSMSMGMGGMINPMMGMNPMAGMMNPMMNPLMNPMLAMQQMMG